MRLTEHEMTSALTGLAKHYLAQIHPEKDEDGFDVEQVWNTIPKINRFHTLQAYGDFVLPTLIALPDIDVEPGTRPVFDDNQILAAAQQVTTDAAAAGKALPDGIDAEEHVKTGFLVTRIAVRFLPVRLDPDALLTDDAIDSAAADFTVPDTLEGL